MITITIKKNYNRLITTIKKDNFPQHSGWLIRNRMPESGLRLHSPTITPTITAKQRRERHKIALDMSERPVCYWRSVFFADETMITDNFFNPKQKLICGARFSKSALPMNSSTFVSTIREVFTKELTRNYTGQVSIVQDNAPCCVKKGKHISFDFLYLCFLLLPRPWLNLLIKK